MIDNWPDIVRDLADPPRKRKSQEEKFFNTLKQVNAYGARPYRASGIKRRFFREVFTA